MGVLIAAGGSIIINLQKSMNSIHAQQELAALTSEIQGRMIAKQVCTSSITLASNQLQNFNPTLASSSSSNKQNGMPLVFQLGNGELVRSGQNLTAYPFLIEGFELFDAQIVVNNPQEQTYLANVIGRFKYKNPTNGPSEFERRLGTLFLSVNSSNQVISCSATNSNSSGGDCLACQQTNNQYITTLNKNSSCRPHPLIHQITVREGTIFNKVSCNNGQGETYSKLCLNGDWVSIGTCSKDSN